MDEMEECIQTFGTSIQPLADVYHQYLQLH